LEKFDGLVKGTVGRVRQTVKNKKRAVLWEVEGGVLGRRSQQYPIWATKVEDGSCLPLTKPGEQ
jgi:hypothetical protein